MVKFSEKSKGIVALVILAWVFASMAVFARYLGTEFELFQQTYLRISVAFFLGVILFLPWVDWKKIKEVSQKDFYVLIGRAVMLYLGVVLFTESVLHASLGNASLIAALPLLPLFGYLMLKEKVHRATLFAIGVGCLGAMVITFEQGGVKFSLGYGEAMALLSVLAFDFSYVARRWQTNLLNNYETTVIMFFFGAVFLFLVSMLLREGLPTVDQFSPALVAILFLAALFNVINLILTNYGFQTVKVAVAGNILTLEVVFALLYGIFLYHEIPSVVELCGGILILGSVIVVNKLES